MLASQNFLVIYSHPCFNRYCPSTLDIFPFKKQQNQIRTWTHAFFTAPQKDEKYSKEHYRFFFFSIWNLYCWISNYIWNKFKVCKIIPVEAMEWENLHRSRSRKYKSWFVISHHGKEEDESTSISNLFSWYIPKYSEDYDFKYYRARGSKYWT